MPYTRKWIASGSILKIRHYGKVTFTEIQGCLNELAELIEQDNLPCMIVDLRDVTAYPSELEVAVQLEGLDRQPRLARRTAFITGERTQDQIRLIVHSARRHEFEVQDFTDEAEATSWLLTGDDRSRPLPADSRADRRTRS